MTVLHQAAQKAVEALTDEQIDAIALKHPMIDLKWGSASLLRPALYALVREAIDAALQQQEVPVASIVYEAYSKTGSYLFASEEGADEFASRFPATAAMSVRARPIIGAALQEVPREPVAWVISQHGRHDRVTLSEDFAERCKADGADVIPLGVFAASPSTTQQQEAGNDTRRLDWLSLQLVSVRAHLRYGSKFLFSSLSNHDEEDGITPGPLRVLIDKAMPAAPSTPESAEKDDAGGGKEDDRG